MSEPTTVTVMAASDRDMFIGYNAKADEYCVFELSDTREISIGDTLVGDFHGHSASTFTANNSTTGDSPRIDLFDWELSLVGAVERFVSVRSATQFIVGHKVIMAHAHEVAHQIINELRGSI